MADARENGAPEKKPLKGMGGFKFGVGKKAPAHMVEVAPAKADEVGVVPMPPAKPTAVKSMFAAVATKPKGPAAAKPKLAAPAAVAKPKPAAPAVAKPVAAAAPVPELADMLLEQQEGEEGVPAAVLTAPAPAAAPAAGFTGDLKEMAELLLNEERRDLYDSAVPDAYVPETRRGFAKFIRTTYSPFRLPEGPIQVGEGEKYYPYQKFVRDYLRKESPYRGVLVYHGLGSGKTCTSIATAEALYASDKRRVIVMTPASLRKNFQSEVSFCGFRHFQYNNYWVELDPADATTTLFASQVLGMTAADIKAARAIWVPDFRRPQSESNFTTLPPESRDEIRKQIQRRLEYARTTNPNGRMQFINYNGITMEKLLRLCCIPNKDGSGPFDNSVIVIDEVHNLIRMMQSSIEPYIRASMQAQGIAKEAEAAGEGRGKQKRQGVPKRVIPVEPITPGPWKPSLCPRPEDFQLKPVVQADGTIKMTRPEMPKLYTRAYLLFRLLTSAKNVKIVALSGTPIINFPEEIGILANILHGFTTVLTGFVAQNGSAALRIMEDTGRAHPYVDFVKAQTERVTVAGAKQELRSTVTMSLLPEGIRKLSDSMGVERIPPEEPRPTFDEIIKGIQEAFAAAGVPFKGELRIRSEELLPMFHDEFNRAFMEQPPEGKQAVIDKLDKRNVLVLTTRLTGLISFYKGSNEELMPRIKRDEIVRVPFSLYGQKAYSIRRGQEIEKESTKGAKDLPAVWKKIYGMGDSKSSSNYKTGSRQACNFAFPPMVARPKPATKKQATEEVQAGVIADERNMLFEYAVLEDERAVEAEANAVVAGPPPAPLVEEGGEEDLDTGDNAASAAEEDAQALREIGEGGEENDEYYEYEEEMEGGGEGDEEEAAAAAPVPAAPVPADADAAVVPAPVVAAAPAPVVAAAPVIPKKTVALWKEEKRLRDAMALRAAGTGPPEAECLDGKPRPGEDFVKGTCERAKECLRTTARKHMLLTNLEDGLPVTSPKMAAILQRVLDTPGSSLVYSAFLTLEGIGIFTVAMDVNGFAPIRIIERPTPGGGYAIDFDDESKASIMKGPGQNRYMLFTGGEKGEIRRMGLNLFNAKFDQLPAALANMLRIYGFTDNKRGELCRVFCITSAGAEGLSLKNVRAVHIMEPYWNYVRMRQVKGRAVRIGSHLDLPEADRDVSIYTYVSVFPDQAQRSRAGEFAIDPDIIQRDKIEDMKMIQDLGFPMAPGQKSYVMTTDELIYAIMERKRKIFDAMETLLKAAAVDCELNMEQHRDGSFTCLKLEGKVGDFLYHPVLAIDLADTGRFAKTPAFVEAAVDAAEAPVVAVAPPAPVAAAAAAAAAARAAFKVMPRRPTGLVKGTDENARQFALNRLKAHVVDFYEEVLPPEEFEAKLDKVDGLVEKYKGAIWLKFAEKYPADVIAKHSDAWKAGAEEAVKGDVVYQRAGPAEIGKEDADDAAPFKPLAKPAGAVQKILLPAAALPPVPVAAAVPPPPPPVAAATPAPVAAVLPPIARPIVPGSPVSGIPPRKMIFGPKQLNYRMESAKDSAGNDIFNMYEFESNRFVGTAGRQDGKPARPIRAVPGWSF